MVFIGAGAAAAGHGGIIGAALAHGLVVLNTIYLFGSISGAHINPAVSFAFLLSGRATWQITITYWISQLLGGTAAAGLLLIVFGGNQNGLGATVLAPQVSVFQGLLVEISLTFVMVNIIFQAAVRERAGDLAGIVIGLTLVALILLGGPLTGASLNPARTLGPAIFTGSLDLFWLYLLGPLTGAALAAGLNQLLPDSR